jgi:hypothetical protein
MNQNIDLGGYGGADYPDIPQDGDFSFQCAGCGDCCRKRKDIVLSGYDLYRICARLQLPPEVVLPAFCLQYTGASTHIPVVRLAPKKSGNCPFFTAENRCAIHESKPLVCALYPLGQTIRTWPGMNLDDPDDIERSVSYFAQDTGCSGTRFRMTLCDYLDGFSIRERQPLDIRWARDCLALSGRVKGLETRLRPVEKSYLNRKMLRALYLDYDFHEEFFPQYDRNIAELERVLCRLEGEGNL